MPGTSLTIRPLAASDEAAWRGLWAGYLEYYETRVPEAVYQSTFARLRSGEDHEFQGLIAHLGDRPVGLVHYLFHRNCWKIENVCYLQDLFTERAARGQGVARALIEAVYARADAAGAPAVYWLTQEFNYRGRMLYDKVGMKTPFIRYNRPV
ncbi:GCN5 family N-acetyltransferase [Defluviimonas sp. 20V17]|uniref:Acetyltransferase (GNAT) family protein n=1 Tax=Allgaiera indica TaxID=765699 RepID=A0AAN5A111_9RHOB|nr:GNAT family N-acetyltransferase [Allgaiera indica]KDB04920.1 GCN5 family N-acetyltransferase [Defluviimonas sp. 20V17]GHE05666.1 GCN5 family N-acetyltransferase [Allgaiera indica]SDX75986.1 Acetyltransferase (GNAT) family protein [Allgaiera indica]